MGSLHLTHPSGAVGSRQHAREQFGFGALLKGLTSVVDTPAGAGSNPQLWVT